MTVVTLHTTSTDPGIWPYGEPLRLVAKEILGGSRCPNHPQAQLEGTSPMFRCPEDGGHAVYRAALPNETLRRAS